LQSFDACNAIPFSTGNMYLQQMNIKDNDLCKIAKKICVFRQCQREVSADYSTGSVVNS
jgi:hypothetical protein